MPTNFIFKNKATVTGIIFKKSISQKMCLRKYSFFFSKREMYYNAVFISLLKKKLVTEQIEVH